jgi:hypothetical protein
MYCQIKRQRIGPRLGRIAPVVDEQQIELRGQQRRAVRQPEPAPDLEERQPLVAQGRPTVHCESPITRQEGASDDERR